MFGSRVTRRRFLASTAAFAGAVMAPCASNAAPGPAIRLTAARRSIQVDGKDASVFGLRQANGNPGVVLDPDQRFTVELSNECGEPTIVHWHGQTPAVRQDGVADTGLVPLIGDGGSQAYDFVPRPGTHWMHSHHALQEQLLMAAPLVVRTAEDAQADLQEVIVLLHDFTFRNPTEILAELMKSGGGNMAGSMPGMDMSHGSMPGMSMEPESMPQRRSGRAQVSGADLNDVAFDAYLANDRTLADPMVVHCERNGAVRLRLINGAAATAFWIELGALTGTVVAVDGDAVKPVRVRRFPMAQAQRVDVLLRLAQGGAYPIMAQREGDTARTGIVLATPGAKIDKIPARAKGNAVAADLSLERHLMAARPLPQRRADIVHRVALTGAMMPYRWGIDDRNWAEHRPLAVTEGQRVELEIVNRSQMAHPMHLHGHHFQVLAIDGKPIAGPMRDTVLVPIGASVGIAFEADNPGRWLFHCHNLYHMAAGMMTEVVYRGFA